MATSVQQRPTKAHDPDSRYGEKATGAVREHPLDTQPMRDLAMQFEEWYIESRDKHAESRIQRFIDHDYYDHEQLTPAERAVYEARNQAPVIFNLIHGAIDWLSGTERRTRVDWNVLPRGPEDDQGAKALKGVVKYVSDANRAQWERSRAFKDAIISGVGFTEEFLRRDKSQEPVGFAYTDWRFLWWDPYSRDLDMGDARYFHRVKFTDLDRAIAMFPERAAALRAIAVNTIDSDYELLDELDGLPAMFALSGSNSSIRTSYSNRIAGSAEGLARRRVRLVETWYPRVQTTKKIRALIADCCDLEGVTFDATSSELAEKVEKRQISLVDSLTTRMSLGIWAPGLGLLQHGESPYKHNQFPFTPVWCFRHHRDGMPYGYVRGMRDAQDEYNKRRAKALFMASTNRVLFEEGAFSEEDEDESLEQIAMPNGEVRLAEGGLKKIEIQTGIEVSKANVEFQLQAKEHVYEGNGITRENLGQNTNAISGRAILAKQQQGAVTTAEVYDLYRLAFEISGQKIIENIKQGMSLPRMIRVLGTAEGVEWLSINQPFLDPETGEVAWENDLLNTLADYKVADQDFRETLRMAMAESLFEVIGKMPPEMALQLIDLAVELTDLPNKDEFVRRVRQLNGQMPTPPDPAQEEAAAAQSAAAQRDADLAAEERAAKADKDRSIADKNRADAGRTRVGAGADALQLAGQTVASAPLAVTADALLAGAGATPPTPGTSGVQPPRPPIPPTPPPPPSTTATPTRSAARSPSSMRRKRPPPTRRPLPTQPRRHLPHPLRPPNRPNPTRLTAWAPPPTSSVPPPKRLPQRAPNRQPPPNRRPRPSRRRRRATSTPKSPRSTRSSTMARSTWPSTARPSARSCASRPAPRPWPASTPTSPRSRKQPRRPPRTPPTRAGTRPTPSSSPIRRTRR